MVKKGELIYGRVRGRIGRNKEGGEGGRKYERKDGTKRNELKRFMELHVIDGWMVREKGGGETEGGGIMEWSKEI